MKNAITINGIEYQEGETIQEFYCFPDEEPCGYLEVQDGKLVLSAHAFSDEVESIQRARDGMAAIMAEWRNERIEDDRMNLTANTDPEEIEIIRERLAHAIEQGVDYIESEKSDPDVGTTVARYISEWRKLAESLKDQDRF